MSTSAPNPFRSKGHPPTESEIQVFLGDDRYGLWKTVSRELGRLCDTIELHWYGADTGWGWHFSKGGKALADLIPNGLCFAVSFQIDASHRMALEKTVGERADLMQRAGAQQHGDWVEWPVYARDDAQLLVKTLRAKAQLA